MIHSSTANSVCLGIREVEVAVTTVMFPILLLILLLLIVVGLRFQFAINESALEGFISQCWATYKLYGWNVKRILPLGT